MPASVDRVSTRDGTSLLVRHWAPSDTRAMPGEPANVARAVPWARVLLVHGLAEHSGRWEHVGDLLASKGLDVTGFDLRGFGASEGRRAWVDRWSRLHDDVEERMKALRAAGSEPVVLYGHSLGGLIALGYVVDGRTEPDALVLSAPALDSTIPAWKRLVARVLNGVAPTMAIPNGLDANHLSHDPLVIEAYGSDPLNVHQSTVRFGFQAFEEQRRVRGRLDRLTIPTLVIHGGEDRIVPTESSKIFEGRRNVTRRVYDRIRHELHNEPEGSAILDEVVMWIRETVESR